LDEGQRRAVAALSGDARLVVIEGAAGAGKTTTLATTRDTLVQHGRRIVVVTPTRKAAHAASVEIGTQTGSAAGLAWQHGWGWDEHGRWTRQPADRAASDAGGDHAPLAPSRHRPGQLQDRPPRPVPAVRPSRLDRRTESPQDRMRE
jgi:hypothetical protein